MNPETANQLPSNLTIGSAFDAPIADDASPAFRMLVGGATNSACEDLSLGDQRLGVASALFRALKLKHPPTARHSLRVALGCSAFASHLGLDAKQREKLEVAALLHDIGKLGVPDQILNKPVQLDAKEGELMEQHVFLGMHILESACDDTDVLNIIRHAGTWYDGSHPRNSEISGNRIPVGARILAIQDAFDAMTTEVVYRQAMPSERAIAELFEHTPTQFDPKLVAEFCELHNQSNAADLSQYARRWVSLATEDVDNIWAFGGAVTKENTSTQSIFQKRLLESMHDGVVFVDTSGRIMVWNRGVQELTGLSKEGVHHKQWQPEIVELRDMEGNLVREKRCPLLGCFATMEESVDRYTVTNRTTKQRLAVNVHTMPVLDAGKTCSGAILIMHDISPEQSLEERVENLHTKATRDALTGVGNRAEFDRRHQELLESHAESGNPLGLIICDIDKFKSINDTYGHQAGDAALIEFATLIDKLSRDTDIVARYGGEEFVLLCPGCDAQVARDKAEEIRRTLASVPQSALKHTKMTASFGVTTLQAGDTAEAMLKRADQGLNQAKEGGRNLVVFLGEEIQETKEEKKPSWFQWGLAKRNEEFEFLRRQLKTTVPIEIVMQKAIGFAGDNKARIVKHDPTSITMTFSEPSPQSVQGRSDRPFTFNTRLSCEQHTGSKHNDTLIDVSITGVRGRDRRHGEIVQRAEQIMHRLRSYLLAEYQ